MAFNITMMAGIVMESTTVLPIVGLLLHERFLKKKARSNLTYQFKKRKTIDFRVQRLYYLEKLV